MIKILFVCHGNICRSPMAEFVMKDMVEKSGLENEFYIESAATSTEVIGNAPHPGTVRKLSEHGISCKGKRARQMRKEDYDRFDKIIAMDYYNIQNMKKFTGDDKDGKVSLLMDYTKRGGEVKDPWYTGNFEETWIDIKEGCQGLIKALINKKGGIIL